MSPTMRCVPSAWMKKGTTPHFPGPLRLASPCTVSIARASGSGAGEAARSAARRSSVLNFSAPVVRCYNRETIYVIQMDVSSFLEHEPRCNNSMSLTNQYHGYYRNLNFNKDTDTYSRSNCPLCVRSTFSGPALTIIVPVCGICAFISYHLQIDAISEPAGECLCQTLVWANYSVCCDERPK